MGRPRKTETGPVPTKERIYSKALELFASKGFDAVSVREITGSLNLNEATLYIHFKNKAALLEEILERLQKNLISPGFKVPPPEAFSAMKSSDLAEMLIEGGRRFFELADRDVRLTWRLLMISQYRYEPAKISLTEQILNMPVSFFTGMLQSMQIAGKIGESVDCTSAGRALAAIFFEYSFRANLKDAWEEDSADDFSALSGALRQFAKGLLAL